MILNLTLPLGQILERQLLGLLICHLSRILDLSQTCIQATKLGWISKQETKNEGQTKQNKKCKKDETQTVRKVLLEASGELLRQRFPRDDDEK